MEQSRADVAAERQAWRDTQPKLDPSKLIFLDESWVATNITWPAATAARHAASG